MDLNAAQANADIQRYNQDARRLAGQYNNQLRSQAYQDQMAKTSGKAAALGGVANTYGGHGNRLYDQSALSSQQAGKYGQTAVNTGVNWLEDYLGNKDKK